jgi:hypothetical protein
LSWKEVKKKFPISQIQNGGEKVFFNFKISKNDYFSGFLLKIQLLCHNFCQHCCQARKDGDDFFFIFHIKNAILIFWVGNNGF